MMNVRTTILVLTSCLVASACQVLDDHRVSARIEATFGDGCADAQGRFANPSVVDGPRLTIEGDNASFEVSFPGTGTFTLSTMTYDFDGVGVHVVLGSQRWFTRSEDAIDPIAGTAEVLWYDQAEGFLDVIFTDVVLQNSEDLSLCTASGRAVANGDGGN